MMETPITQQNLIEQLRIAFPELEQQYQERVYMQCGEQLPSNYEVIGRLLEPKFKEDLAKGEVTEFLKRVAFFIERVCSSRDIEAINVIWIEIFEWLIFKRNELGLLWPVLGPMTKEKIKDAAQRWSVAARRFGHTEDLPLENLPKE